MPNQHTLERALRYDIHRWSEAPSVEEAIRQLCKELQSIPAFIRRESLTVKLLKSIILNLYAHSLADSDYYTAYYRMKGKYNKGGRYNTLHISYSLVSVVDGLESLGYIENHLGFYDRRDGGNSRMSRMRATPKLLRLLSEAHAVHPHMLRTAPDRECIILRTPDATGKQREMDYNDTELTNQLRADVQAYNALLSRSQIDIVLPHDVAEEDRLKPDLTNRFVQRIFNNGCWNQGGRFFGGWWQSLPKRYRRGITIDGTPSIELDFSGLHIALLYALEGIDYEAEGWSDPYSIDTVEQTPELRKLLKTVLLIALNAKDLNTTILAVREEIRTRQDLSWAVDRRINVEELVLKFLHRHKQISRYFFSGKGIWLQNIDSSIAARTLKYLTHLNIPALCLHDSFIVSQDQFCVLLQAMSTSYCNELGTRTQRNWDDANPRIKASGYRADMVNTIVQENLHTKYDFTYKQ